MFLKIVISKIFKFFGIKMNVKNFLFYVTNFYATKIKFYKNHEIKLQNKDFRLIPIIIISYNQYTFLKELIDYLLSIGHKRIIVIDNNSSYSLLLQYLDEIEKNNKVEVHKLDKNYGHMVFWNVKSLYEKYSKGYYIVTDPDIIPLKECPSDFIFHLKKELDSNFSVFKVGLSIKIDDLPQANLNREEIYKWELQFWKKKNQNNNYIGQIDTTLAIYRPNSYKFDYLFYKAIRMKYPFQLRHKSWYIDNQNLSEEMIYLFKTSNMSSSWKLDNEGQIIRNLYKTKGN